jgi:hypothetical protein
MGSFKETALRILADNGIDQPRPGQWYSQQAWLDSFQTISNRIGPATLFVIGQKIPENAQFPPSLDTIEKALPAIDVAYHMNHRLRGETLFNPGTGQMKEGIGHYTFTKTGPSRGEMVCDNPYPCEFDKGIIDAMVRRFKPSGSIVAEVIHDDRAPCRKKGADSCTYAISW